MRVLSLILVVVALSCGETSEKNAEEKTPNFAKTCPGEGDYEYADRVVEGKGELRTPSAINEKENAINGVRGNTGSGSQDVFSRGYDIESNNHILVLEWTERKVENVEGDDFVIFENAFVFGKDKVFLDAIVVSVSNDLKTWSTFPHDYVAKDETRYSANPNDWMGFAGIHPTNYDSDNTDCVSPMDAISGGDKFDLDSLEKGDPMRSGFRYLRLQSAPTIVNPDTKQNYPRDAIADGFDLDGVYAKETTYLKSVD